MDVTDISHNKKFLKTAEPFFSNRRLSPDKFLLEEKGNTRSNVKVLTNAFNHFFIITTSCLDLKGCETFFENLKSLPESFKNNLGSKRIKTCCLTNDDFLLKEVDKKEVRPRN